MKQQYNIYFIVIDYKKFKSHDFFVFGPFYLMANFNWIHFTIIHRPSANIKGLESSNFLQETTTSQFFVPL